jgi:hypothetical protein
VTFPAPHPRIGEIRIWDDGNEATIKVGNITHDHLNPYDETLTEEEIACRVTEGVILFLDLLFADRVVFWRHLSGHAGGWRVLEEWKKLPHLGDDIETCIWSRPL